MANKYGVYRVSTQRYPSLSIREMRKAGNFDSKYMFSLYWGSGLSMTGSINRYAISLSVSGLKMDEPEMRVIELTYTQQKLGGLRTWFKCPTCGRRCGVLWWAYGQFRCLKCGDLAYPQCLERKSVRMRGVDMIHKIRRRMGWEKGADKPIGDKPKGMHWSTFHRELERYRDYQRRLFGQLAAEAAYRDAVQRSFMNRYGVTASNGKSKT